jgi:integrating conjugative element protein (TIGR03758 family)
MNVSAFTAAAGVSPDAVKFVITAFVAIAALTWLAWLAYAQFLAWRQDKIEFWEMVSALVQGAAVVLLMTFYAR